MFRPTTSPRPMQWGPQLYTKDGRPRARRPLSAFHRVKWSKRLPYGISVPLAGGVLWTVYRFYSQSVALTPQQKFMNKIAVVPHGVLGSQLHDSGSLVFVADSPDFSTAVVDPAGLHHIHGTADGAGGAAAAVYKWLGITGQFPEDVRLGISALGDAKLHRYPLPPNLVKEQQEKLEKEAAKHRAAVQEKPAVKQAEQQQPKDAAGMPVQQKPLPAPGSMAEYSAARKEQLERGKNEKDLINDKLYSRAVIHAVGPDFRVGKWTDREASLALARGYRNILHEFVISDCDTLRIAPISSGIFAGPLYNMMPVLTQEGLAQGFDQLHEYDKEVLLKPKKKIELCTFLLREWDTFCNAMDYVAPPEASGVAPAAKA